MPYYSFTLEFSLPNEDDDPGDFLDQIYEAGCDDGVVGIGAKGMIAVSFTRESNNAIQAYEEARVQVLKAIPNAKIIGLIEE